MRLAALIRFAMVPNKFSSVVQFPVAQMTNSQIRQQVNEELIKS